MKLADDLWLRGKAAQASMMHLITYSTAFAGAAAIQGAKLGFTAPIGFCAAMGRASGAANANADMGPSVPHQQAAAKAIATAERVAEAVMSEPANAPDPAPWPDVAPAVSGPSPHLLDSPRDGKGDDLTELKGIGPKLATALSEFGIYHFDQLASLDEEGIAWLDTQQPGFRMICARHGIVEQAAARAS